VTHRFSISTDQICFTIEQNLNAIAMIMKRAIQAITFDTEIISPEEYINLSEKEKENVKSATIIPPSLGDKEFGKIQITYKIPTYRIAK
jgi:hypothetical protein